MWFLVETGNIKNYLLVHRNLPLVQTKRFYISPVRSVLFLVTVLLFNQNLVVSQEATNPYSIVDEVSAKSATINSTRELFNLYANAANQLTIRGNYSLADSLYVIADNYMDSSIDSSELVKMVTYRAMMFKIQGKYTNSIQDYLWLLDYHMKNQDINSQVYTYARIAEFYRASENAEESEKALLKGKALIDQATDSAAVAYLYSRIAANQNQFSHNMDSTIYYAEKGLTWAIQNRSALTLSLIHI